MFLKFHNLQIKKYSSCARLLQPYFVRYVQLHYNYYQFTFKIFKHFKNIVVTYAGKGYFQLHPVGIDF